MTNDARSGFRKNPTPAAVLCVLATSARKGSNRLHDRSETPRRGRAPPFRCSWRLVEKYFLAAIRSPPAGPWPALVAAAEPFFPPSASCAIPEQPWPKRNVSLTRIPNTDGLPFGSFFGFPLGSYFLNSNRSIAATNSHERYFQSLVVLSAKGMRYHRFERFARSFSSEIEFGRGVDPSVIASHRKPEITQNVVSAPIKYRANCCS